MNTLLSAISYEAKSLACEIQSVLDGKTSEWFVSSSIDQCVEMLNLLGYMKENLLSVITWSSAQQALLDGMLTREEALPDCYRVKNMQQLPQHLLANDWPENLRFLFERCNVFLEWIVQIESLIEESSLNGEGKPLAA